MIFNSLRIKQIELNLHAVLLLNRDGDVKYRLIRFQGVGDVQGLQREIIRQLTRARELTLARILLRERAWVGHIFELVRAG